MEATQEAITVRNIFDKKSTRKTKATKTRKKTLFNGKLSRF